MAMVAIPTTTRECNERSVSTNLIYGPTREVVSSLDDKDFQCREGGEEGWPW